MHEIPLTFSSQKFILGGRERIRKALDMLKKRKFASVLIILIVIPVFIFILSQNQKSQRVLGNSASVNSEEAKSILNNLDDFMELPKDETPSIGTISDKNNLPNEAFFERAENGDKVIVYSKLGRAILYRPLTNKIIDVAYIDSGVIGSDAELPNPDLAQTTPTPIFPSISPIPQITLGPVQAVITVTSTPALAL